MSPAKPAERVAVNRVRRLFAASSAGLGAKLAVAACS